MAIELSVEGNGISFSIRLSTTFIEVLNVLKEKDNALLTECFPMQDFGEKTEVNLGKFIDGLSLLYKALIGEGTRLLTTYSFKELPEYPTSGGARGINVIINGEPAGIDGGLGECKIRKGAYEKPDGSLSFREEIDIRDKDIIETDNFKVKIIKSKPKKLMEVKELKNLLDTIKDMPRSETVYIILG